MTRREDYNRSSMTVTLDVARYIASLVEAAPVIQADHYKLPLPLPPLPNPHLSPAERAAAWLESRDHFPKDVPVLSDFAMTREGIYDDEW